MKSGFFEAIKAFAENLGFDLVGIVPFRPVKEAEAFLKKWTAKNYHGEMRYLENFKERRERLRGKIPDAQSLIVLGVNYFPGGAKPGMKASFPQGRIARYAWGKDYHEAVREKLRKLEGFLREKHPETRCVSCVDTEPLFEKAYAEKAGFGFCGKHTNLLTKRFGPWVFLAEIVTNLKPDFDPPKAKGNCGHCRRCLDACPTKAILPSREIDARRCIAYLTIEHKSIIPEELRPLMKDWVFGCDECLKACPFAKFSKETGWLEFKPEAGFGSSLDLLSLFRIKNNRDYKRKFEGTPLSRASRKMMLRNASVALGNLKAKEAIPALEQALENEAPLVRIHAAWALGRIRKEECREVCD